LEQFLHPLYSVCKGVELLEKRDVEPLKDLIDAFDAQIATNVTSKAV